ncbi:MAG: VanZ family protein [Clostridia bacterium]|nr:VanZ family protein [Clostridia bacterium]
MNTKHFANKKLLATLFGICIFLTIWIFLLKLCIPGRIHFDNINSLTMEEWFFLGINPTKSLPLFCKTQQLLFEYIIEQTVNMVGFVPFGIIAPFVIKKRYALLSGVAIILAIEFTQLFGRIGGFDIIDMATNTLGICIGMLVHKVFFSKLSSPTVDKLCKICLYIFVPVAIYALYSLIFVFPATLPA